MKYRKSVLILIAALLLAVLLGACGEGILPPKETAAPTPKPMPTPTPTPAPAPFAGEIESIEVSQARVGEASVSVSGCLAARRDTEVTVLLSAPLGHEPDERESLAVSRDGGLVGVFAADETSTESRLRFSLTGADAGLLAAGEYSFTALADGAERSCRALLTEMRPLRVLVVPVLGNFGGESGYPADGWQDAPLALLREFPLANDGLKAVTAPGLRLAEESDLHTEEGLVRAWEALRERAGLLEGYDLILGFVSGAMGTSGTLGCFGRDGIALLDASQEDCGAALCRFAAQTLGAADAEAGSEGWQALSALFSSPQPEVIRDGRLHVGGLLYPDGTAAIRPLCTGESFGAGRTVTPFDHDGSYALVFGDENGTVLERDAFTPDFRWSGEGSSVMGAAPIELTVSVPVGASTLRLVGPVPSEDGGTTEGELFFAELPAEPYTSSFTVLPEAEQLRGTVRVEWETAQTSAPPAPEETEADGAEAEETEAEPAPPLPEPYYELYMCFGGQQLPVYRGSLRYAELDMPSLPKPERFTFLLLTCGGRTSTTAGSPELQLP